MSLATVQTLQRLGLPPGSRLVAGGRGLTRVVTWSATLRTHAPAFASLKTGEFLLISTTNLSLLDPQMSLVKLLQSVFRVGVSGAAIVGPIPADCARWADLNDFPLFDLPTGSHLNDIESAISRAIADSRREFDRRAHELYRQLTQLAIEERGMAAIVDELARISGKAALLLDVGLVPREGSATNGLRAALPALSRLAGDVATWTKRVPISAAEPPVRFFDLSEAGGVLIAPVMTRDGVAGYMAIAARQVDLDGLDEAAVAGAAASGAIELSRERAVLEAQERAQAGIVEEIVAGTTGPGEALRRRAERVQIDLDPEHCVIVIVASTGDLTATIVDSSVREARTALGVAQGGIVAGRLVLVTTVGDRRLATASESLREHIVWRLGATDISIGIGRWVPGLEGLRQSYREALEAVRLGQEVSGAGRTTFYSELGLYRLFLSFRDHPELERFYQDTMGRLIVFDAKGDGEILRTLDAYFASNGSPTEAATRLHVHRNTLLYRLQRIRSIADIDLDDPEVRLSLQIALRIRRILTLTGEARPAEAAS